MTTASVKEGLNFTLLLLLSYVSFIYIPGISFNFFGFLDFVSLRFFWLFHVIRLFAFEPASDRFHKIGVVGNNWFVGWLVSFLRKGSKDFSDFLHEVREL